MRFNQIYQVYKVVYDPTGSSSVRTVLLKEFTAYIDALSYIKDLPKDGSEYRVHAMDLV
jgi:hypothetical protein